MTVVECFGCMFLAFGPPFAMVIYTIAHDPVRIIIFIASAFIWLVSLLVSSTWWFMVFPLRNELAFGLVFSVLFQELFRGFVYLMLRKAQLGLTKMNEDTSSIIGNKHIVSYTTGLAFGIMTGAFSLMNVLADAIGPGTMGIKSGTEKFFITSSAITLCFILLHTFWGVIFFDAMDKKNKTLVAVVILSHLLASSLTLFNKYQIYSLTIVPIAINCALMGLLAFKQAGGSYSSFKSCLVLR